MDRKVIKSVGIDIGTTTTQVIFSLLTVVNRAPASQVPAYEFIGREVVYQSPIVFTPINYDGVIDNDKLRKFIYQQVAQAGFTIEAIETGAIIITGETAKAENARSSLFDLSQQLGDFVVATAGPHLESIIAGRGSGAQTLSQENHLRVINIDIGGGTSNYVVFDCGKVVDTACLNIGGRLIEFDKNESGPRTVRFIHKAGVEVIKDLFGDHISPRDLTEDHIRRISHRMAQVIVEVLIGQLSPLSARLLMTPALTLNQDQSSAHQNSIVFLSGGVGECYYEQQQQIMEANRFQDIGPSLALSLLKNVDLAQFNVKRPQQTLRATVIGAGAHSLALSGSTIWLDETELPLKNIPVVHPHIEWQIQNATQICQEILIAAQRMDLSLLTDRYAIAIDDSMPMTHNSVQVLAEALAMFFSHYSNSNYTALVIMHQDIGKAVGMALQPQLKEHRVMVIDEVMTREGDYIDIGKGYFGGEIVPVTVKSLAFPG